MKTIRVVAAIIKATNEAGETIIFSTQRGYGDFKGGWEFPGGRRQGLEDEKKTLERAFNDVFKIKCDINDYMTHSICEYPGHIVDLKIYECDYKSGEFNLDIHSEYKWVGIEELLDYDLADADVILSKFIIKKFIEESRNK